MADTVRYLMEEMVPELDELEARGYFTRIELKQIVQKRMHFEYLLKRKAALKTDYLRYIDYESKLEELRKGRKKLQNQPPRKDSLAEYALVRRVHFIYQRATRKFRGDLRLWTAWLAFCRAHSSSRQASKVLTRALQLHPTATGLWVAAAAWEYQHNRNPTAARNIMQRGLRMVKDSPAMWVEYFRLELLYAAQLRARRKILGIASPDVSTREGTGAQLAEVTGEDMTPQDESVKAEQAVLQGQVALLVFRSAISAIPRNVRFRGRFLEVLNGFTFEGAQTIKEQILASMAADFPTVEDAWAVRAQHALGTSSTTRLQAATAVFQQAVEAVPTPRMFDLFAQFLSSRLRDALTSTSLDTSSDASNLAQQLLAVCQRAHESGAASEELLLLWPTLALRVGHLDAARHAAEVACRNMPDSVQLWCQRLAFEAGRSAVEACHSQQSIAHEASNLESIAFQAVAAVQPATAAPVWTLAFEALLGAQVSVQPLAERLLTVLTGMPKGPLMGGMGTAAASAVDAVRHQSGVSVGHQLICRLLTIPPPGGTFFQHCIELGMQEPASKQRHQRLTELFEASVAAYGREHATFWLQYARYMQSQPEGAASVHWRAVKMLDDPEVFVAAYQELHRQ